jgi:hypothetical protein
VFNLQIGNWQSAIGNLKGSACSLPVNFPKLYRLLAILDHDRLAWFQLVAAVRRLCSGIAD